jgi:uncharacterized repeat protein (TIGR02059 family)
MTLANIVPAASAFTVLVNSVARAVNSVVVSGTNVQLTLANPVVNGNVVTVAYTKPATSPLQTSASGQAITITAQAVTNKVTATVTPAYVSSSIENATPTVLTLTYNLALGTTIPATSAFSVLVNAVARTVSSVSVSGTKVQLVLASGIKYGDIITFGYTKPAANALQTAAGGQAATISGQSVINNLANPAKDALPITITMTISPNHHINRILNILLVYTGSLATQAASITPEIIRISDLTGKLFNETFLTTGVTSVKIPVNLRSGIYNVILSTAGVQMAAQRMIVY